MPFSLSDDDYLHFVAGSVGQMAAIVSDLGDDRACERADVPGANTAYGLLTHCLAVIEYWAGEVNLGRDAHRDRDAEFSATGPVSPLLERTETVLAQLETDLAGTDPGAPPRKPPPGWADRPDVKRSQGRVLMHVAQEVAQHLGQLEVLRDALGEHIAPFDPPLDWLRKKRTVKWLRAAPDRLPAWVADMDFPPAPPIRAAVEAMFDRGDLGYPEWDLDPLADAFVDRMTGRYGWTPDRAHVRPVSDVIQALQVILELGTEPGDGVVAHVPNYPPFLAGVAEMKRELRAVRLHANGGTWRWRGDEFEAAAHGAKVLLLVNPQNPTGRCFSPEELHEVAAVAERHDLLVVCDEIHADLVHDPHRHLPFAAIAPERTVTITSATKAFNIAGVRTAVAHVGAAWLRDRWPTGPHTLFGTPATLGVEATVAAWRDGDDWLDRLRHHLRGQRDHLVERIATVPGLELCTPDAGYLAWIDCRGANLPDDPAAFFRSHAGLELAPGPDYDPDHGAGWVRLNFATSRTILDEMLDRMAASLP